MTKKQIKLHWIRLYVQGNCDEEKLRERVGDLDDDMWKELKKKRKENAIEEEKQKTAINRRYPGLRTFSKLVDTAYKITNL